MPKKTFNLNPALQFITTPESQDGPPEGYKMNPLYIEKKTRRVQMLMQPSLYSKIKARADQEGRSFNQMVHSMLEAETEKE